MLQWCREHLVGCFGHELFPSIKSAAIGCPVEHSWIKCSPCCWLWSQPMTKAFKPKRELACVGPAAYRGAVDALKKGLSVVSGTCQRRSIPTLPHPVVLTGTVNPLQWVPYRDCKAFFSDHAHLWPAASPLYNPSTSSENMASSCTFTPIFVELNTQRPGLDQAQLMLGFESLGWVQAAVLHPTLRLPSWERVQKWQLTVNCSDNAFVLLRMI